MRAIIIAGALALAGCVSASVNMLDERTMIVSGRGNAYVTEADVTRTMLVRAATEAQSRGFPYFVVLGSQDKSSTSSFTTPTTTNGSAVGSSNCYGGYCSGQVSGTSTTYGGQTFTFNHPGADAIVRFLTEEEARGTPGAWSVASVLAANPPRDSH